MIDLLLRVYSRNADVRYVHAVHEAFESWLRRVFGSGAITSTPAKTLRKERFNKISAGNSSENMDDILASQQRKRLDFDGEQGSGKGGKRPR